MNVFEYLDSKQLKITWTLIEIGIDFIDYNYKIKIGEIKDYVYKLILAGADDNLTDFLICDNNSYSYIGFLVQKLARAENVDLKKEKRKWVLYVVDTAASGLNENCENDEIWDFEDLYGYLDCPEDYPVKPNDGYLTREDIRTFKEQVNEWARKETARLREIDKAQ